LRHHRIGAGLNRVDSVGGRLRLGAGERHGRFVQSHVVFPSVYYLPAKLSRSSDCIMIISHYYDRNAMGGPATITSG
jgi:hypothetical protein